MKKLRIKITGVSYGRMVSILHDVEVPDFTIKTGRKLGNLDMPDSSIEEQEADYIDENYNTLVWDHANKSDLWPVQGYKIIRKADKKKKIELVIALAGQVLEKEEQRLNFAATLAKMYKDIKKLSVENIVKVVLLTMNVAIDVTVATLKGINESLTEMTKDDERVNKISEQN